MALMIILEKECGKVILPFSFAQVDFFFLSSWTSSAPVKIQVAKIGSASVSEY